MKWTQHKNETLPCGTSDCGRYHIAQSSRTDSRCLLWKGWELMGIFADRDAAKAAALADSRE